jgi:LPS export ABC transporter protein LptC
MMFFVFYSYKTSTKTKNVTVSTATVGISHIIKNFFTIQDVEKVKIILKAVSAVVNKNNKNINLKLLTLKFHDNDKYVLTLTAEEANINTMTYDVLGVGKCSLDTASGEHLETINLNYDAKKKIIYSNNNIKIIKSNEIIYGTSFKSDIKFNKIVIKNQKVIFNKV